MARAMLELVPGYAPDAWRVQADAAHLPFRRGALGGAVNRQAGVGVQPGALGGSPVYVMPSTSGANAHASLDSLSDHLRAAAALADRLG
ncbi:MAG: hypothetical protein WHS89_04175 [Acidimicrobiales bacterium]